MARLGAAVGLSAFPVMLLILTGKSTFWAIRLKALAFKRTIIHGTFGENRP